jgi:DNA-binding response OmpR family regulator
MVYVSVMVPRILIVDDEQDFIELLQYKLGGHGYDLIIANDGVHALSQARTLKPQLILLDILLPDLDGLSVCEILRRQPATKKIPIIFMSALSGDITKRTATMHADDFFTKPLDLNRLEKRIEELLDIGHTVN